MRAESEPRCGCRRERVEQRRGLLSERPLADGPSRSHEGPSEEDSGAAHQPTWTGPARQPQVRATIGIEVPVIPLASSVERNTMMAAISAAVAQRDGSAFGIAARFSALSMIRGRTQFAVMPSRLVSSAKDSVQRMSAALAIAYPAAPFSPFSAAVEATLTTRP